MSKQTTEKRIIRRIIALAILISIGFGLLFWLVDILVETALFQQSLHDPTISSPQTFVDAAFGRLTPYELLARGSFLLLSIAVGITVGLWIRRLWIKEVRLNTYIENAPVGILVIDRNGKHLRANERASRLTGIPHDELLTMQAGDHHDHERATFELEQLETAFSRDNHSFETTFHTRRGATIDVEVDMVTLPGDEVMVFFRDVTDLHEARRKIEHQAEEMRSLAGHIDKAREEQNAHIAREIHDELGQLLSAIEMNLSTLARHVDQSDGALDPSLISRTLAEARTIAQRATDSTRLLVNELRPAVLDTLGLRGSLEWLVSEYSRNVGVHIDFACEGEMGGLDESVSVVLFRFVQECLTNVVRHAHAEHAVVTASMIDHSVEVVVEDNGRGFEQQNRPAGSLGLVSMRERAFAVGGELAVESTLGRGTRVTVTVPVENAR